MVGGIINAFRPHRETCLHWGSGQGPGHVEGQDWSLLYLSRMIKDYTLVVGKYDASEVIEFRIMDPTCSLPWMPYTGGDLVPVRVVNGGRLPDGSTTYVCRVIQDGRLMFGYYNIESALAYHELGAVHTTTSMELLVLL